MSRSGSLIDEARAEQLRTRILLGLIGFAAMWALAFLTTALQLRWMPPFSVLALLPYGWAWIAWAQIWGTPRSSGWAPSTGDRDVVLFLLLGAPIALISIVSALHDAQQTAAEAIPNRSNGDWHFEQVFGEAPRRENRPVYSARRDLSGGKNPLDSDFRDLLQFSVSSPDAARQLLGASGLELGRPASTEYENNFHPRTFPSTWRPLSLSADLELWRSGSAIAWLDAENLAVYMVLPPGWQPRQ